MLRGGSAGTSAGADLGPSLPRKRRGAGATEVLPKTGNTSLPLLRIQGASRKGKHLAPQGQARGQPAPVGVGRGLRPLASKTHRFLKTTGTCASPFRDRTHSEITPNVCTLTGTGFRKSLPRRDPSRGQAGVKAPRVFVGVYCILNLHKHSLPPLANSSHRNPRSATIPAQRSKTSGDAPRGQGITDAHRSHRSATIPTLESERVGMLREGRRGTSSTASRWAMQPAILFRFLKRRSSPKGRIILSRVKKTCKDEKENIK